MYDKLLKTLHSICIYSNIVYFIPGLYSLYSFKKYYKLMGILIILTGICSVIHHSNEVAGISIKFWTYADTSLAYIVTIIAFLTLIYLKLYKHRLSTPLVLTTGFLMTLSIIFYILSEIEYNTPGKGDPVQSWGSGIIIEQFEDIKESEQVLYLTYHTIWHLLSGITGLLWVVTISQ